MAFNPNDPQTINIRIFGAVCDGSTDDYNALTNALAYVTAIGGGTLYIPGIMAIASAHLVSNGCFHINSNTKLMGTPGVSGITVTGNSVMPAALFLSNGANSNFQNIHFEGLTFTGNNTAVGVNTEGFWELNPTGSVPSSGFKIRNCVFVNWKQSYWIGFRNDTGTADVYDIEVSGCRFISQTGNNIGQSNIGISNWCLLFQGNTNAFVRDFVVRDNFCEATWIKGLSVCFSNTHSGSFINNQVVNGGTNINNETGAYAFICYDNSYLLDPSHQGGIHAPHDIDFVANHVVNQRSCGLYCASCYHINWIGGSVTGQYDPNVGGTLPLAGLSFNSTSGTISNTNISSCLQGIWVTGLDLSNTGLVYGDVGVNNVKIDSFTANSCGIKISGQTDTSFTPKPSIIISNCSVEVAGATSTGFSLLGPSSAPLPYVTISSCNVYATYTCLIHQADSSANPGYAYLLSVTDCSFRGPCTNALVTVPTTTHTPLNISNCTFDGSLISSVNTNASGLVLDGETQLNLSNLWFENFSAGTTNHYISLGGCKGSMRGVQAVNCSRGPVSADFGLALPTWSAQQGAFIQNLQPSGAGHLIGYTNTNGSTTWTEL